MARTSRAYPLLVTFSVSKWCTSSRRNFSRHLALGGSDDLEISPLCSANAHAISTSYDWMLVIAAPFILGVQDPYSIRDSKLTLVLDKLEAWREGWVRTGRTALWGYLPWE